jgi:hypothetical protein
VNGPELWELIADLADELALPPEYVRCQFGSHGEAATIVVVDRRGNTCSEVSIAEAREMTHRRRTERDRRRTITARRVEQQASCRDQFERLADDRGWFDRGWAI